MTFRMRLALWLWGCVAAAGLLGVLTTGVSPQRERAPGLLVLLLAAAPVAKWLAAWVSRPLLGLRQAAKDLARGAPGGRLPPFRDGDLQPLADAFNRLSLRLQEAITARDHALELLRQLGEALLEVDDSGCIRSANPAALRLLGYGEAGLLGRPITQLLPEDADPHALEQGGETTWRRSDGGRLPVRIRVSRIHDPAGGSVRLHLAQEVCDRSATGPTRADAEGRLRALFEASQDAILVLAEGALLDCNRAAEELFGVGRKALLGRTLLSLSPERQEDGRPSAVLLDEYFDAVLHGRGQFRPWRFEGTRGQVETELGLSGFELRGKEHILAVIRDIGGRRRAEEQLRLAAAVFEHSHEGIMITDAEGALVDINRAFTRITGFTREEVLHRPPDFGLAEAHPRPFDIPRLILPEGHWQGEVRAQRKQGEPYIQWLTLSAVRDEQGRARHYVGLFSDISGLVTAREEARYLAQHDQLTGLANRTLFMDRLTHELDRAARQGSLVSLMFLDLDAFKEVNDRLGHSAGDALLVEVAHRLRTRTRKMDTLARLGGDEFTIVMPDLQRPEDARQAAEKLVAEVARPFLLAGGEARVTVSLGIALFPQDGKEVDTLLRQADHAMYVAKAVGKNSYRFAIPPGERA